MWERELASKGTYVKIHAWLLIWAWCFLIPYGTLIWTHTKHYQPANPHHHMLTGFVGVILAIIGFAYGIKHFSTFSKDDSFRVAHAVTGTIATAGMLLQVVMCAFMRKPRYHGEPSSEWPLWQKIGQRVHKYTGWLWIAFGLVACETGTHITRSDEKFTGGMIGALLCTAVVTATAVTIHKKKVKTGADPSEHETGEEKKAESAKQDIEAPPSEAFEKFGIEMENMEEIEIDDTVAQ